MSNSLRVSVAIPTRDRPVHLERLLVSLLEGQRVPDEIVIADQSVDSRTAVLVDRFRAENLSITWALRRSNAVGVSRNRNLAIATATGDFLAFVDDDMSVATDWLTCMLAEWQNRWDAKSVLITGPILAPPGSKWSSGTAGRLSLLRRVFTDPPDTTDVLYSGHFGGPRIVFLKLGTRAFDLRLGPGSPFARADDADFGYSALRAGVPIVYEPSVRATHWEVSPLLPRRSFTEGRGFGAVMAKHSRDGWKSAKRLLFKAFVTNAAKAAKYLFSGHLGEAAGRAAFVIGTGLGFLQWSVLDRLKRLPEEP